MSSSSHTADGHPVPAGNTRAPDSLAHWVVKTTRINEMIAWYQTVFGAWIVHEDRLITFLTWDEESHRLALVKVPRFFHYVFPLARLRRKIYGIDHLALTFTSLERLLLTYERLKKVGITPVWSINHGPTTSLYYEDPDGIRLEPKTFPLSRRPRTTSAVTPSPRTRLGSTSTPIIYSSDCAAAPAPPSWSSKGRAPGPVRNHAPTSTQSPGRRSNWSDTMAVMIGAEISSKVRGAPLLRLPRTCDAVTAVSHVRGGSAVGRWRR
jgi:Glyoxalase/Bleomycin resistance protein/Dioxygenase superfamily